MQNANRFSPAKLAWVASLGLCLLAAGCGRGGFKLVPVSGRVTANGQPVAEARVTFQPQGGGPGSYGQSDAEGRFVLRSVLDDSRGAVAGPHVVTITTAKDTNASDDGGGGTTGELAPPRFRDGSVEFVVPPKGTDSADFELQAAAPARP
jgi:hypothetical protein